MVHETAAATMSSEGARKEKERAQLGAQLLVAASAGELLQLRTLLKRGAPVDYEEKDTGVFCLAVRGFGRVGSTPLHYAARIGHHGCVSELLSAGASLNKKNKEQITPMHFAAANGHLETVKRLHAAGADIHVRDMYGDTPLHLASKMGRTHIVAFLLAQGAQPGPRNVDNTNLHLSINYKGHCRYAVHKTPCNCSMVAPDLAKAVTMKSVVFRDHGKKPVDLGHTDEVRGTLRRAAFARQMGIHHTETEMTSQPWRPASVPSIVPAPPGLPTLRTAAGGATSKKV